MRELAIQTQIVKWYYNDFNGQKKSLFAVRNENLGKKDIYAVNRGVQSGVSDLILVLNGKVLFIEVKTDTNKQSKNQHAFETMITDNGLNYYIVRCLDDFKTIVNGI